MLSCLYIIELTLNNLWPLWPGWYSTCWCYELTLSISFLEAEILGFLWKFKLKKYLLIIPVKCLHVLNVFVGFRSNKSLFTSGL